MIDFIEEDIRKIRSPRQRAIAIVNKMQDLGYYKDGYVAGLTQSAAETFKSKQGNCLSYTHLYVALARLAGLNAQYEIVHIPPRFSVSDGVLEHQVHIRVRVQLPNRFRQNQYVHIDFNQRTEQYEGMVVSDDWATALHYSNDAVVLWQGGESERAFTTISEAIRLSSRNPDLWVNLATFYNSIGDRNAAREVVSYALDLDSSHVIALSLLAATTDTALPLKVQNRLVRYKSNNAFYQFALAQRAHQETALFQSLQHIDRAIQLNKREPDFYAFKAKLLIAMNEPEEALNAYKVALNKSKDRMQQQTIQMAIEALLNSASVSLRKSA